MNRGFAAAFDAVGFHPSIDAAIAAARAVPLSDRTFGIHLRGGDMFGHYRAWTAYWYKVVPLPVARALIQRFQAEGCQVVVFGEDTQSIADLCETTGATDASTVRPTTAMTSAEAAMFDMVLLAQCDRIVSGWSGFAIQAASISDKSVEHYLDIVPPSDVVAATKADLGSHDDRYDPGRRAFAWWAAYYGARHELTYEEGVELLRASIEADPTNPRARLRLAATELPRGSPRVG